MTSFCKVPGWNPARETAGDPGILVREPNADVESASTHTICNTGHRRAAARFDTVLTINDTPSQLAYIKEARAAKPEFSANN